MKQYAKQMNPAYQESPLYIFGFDGTVYENIILTGNSGYREHTIPEYNSIVQYYDEAAEALEDLENKTDYDMPEWKNATEIIRYYFPESEYRSNGKLYTTRDIHNIRECLRKYCTNDYFRGNVYREMLTALTGKTWYEKQLCGVCQGDWINCIYPAEEWTQEALEALETEYFNTGTEWIIHDENTVPEGPDDISGYGIYCHSWDIEDIRKEIASEIGCNPEELTLYEYAGSVAVDTWKAVTA